MSEAIVYVDHSEVHEGKLDALNVAIEEIVAFVRDHEPQLISYGFYVNDAARSMTVVAVHPDAASLELHMDVAGPEFRKFKELITLKTIEVYGPVSDRALGQLQQKALSLGGANLLVDELRGGFARPISAGP